MANAASRKAAIMFLLAFVFYASITRGQAEDIGFMLQPTHAVTHGPISVPYLMQQSSRHQAAAAIPTVVSLKLPATLTGAKSTEAQPETLYFAQLAGMAAALLSVFWAAKVSLMRKSRPMQEFCMSAYSGISTIEEPRSSFLHHTLPFQFASPRGCSTRPLPARRSRALPPLRMVRNVDTPEAVIFYGPNPVFTKGATLAGGVARLITEAVSVGASCILLLDKDAIEEKQAASLVEQCQVPKVQQSLHIYQSTNYSSPDPRALLEAIASVTITPAGFGGSSGFGARAPETPRSPLPKHCVVLVQGPGRRNQCIASRKAGMRVVCIEGAGEDKASEEYIDDVADAVVTSLGEEGDWEVVTVDDISTPGSFWLNPPHPRDEFGNKVDVANLWAAPTNTSPQSQAAPDTSNSSPSGKQEVGDDGLTDEERAILADISPAKR